MERSLLVMATAILALGCAQVTGFGDGDTGRGTLHLLLEATYPAGAEVQVRVENGGDVPYLYNPYFQACSMTYRDASGREFPIPPGTHCDMYAEEEIPPGETVTLFTWNLTECVEDAWGCMKAEPLPPGQYTIEGEFKAMVGGQTAHVEATFRIVP